MTHIVTGAAGFIGFHLVRRLLDRGDEVLGIDSINDYYEPTLKYARLAQLGIDAREAALGQLCRSRSDSHFDFIRLSLEEGEQLCTLVLERAPDRVINLAAQAGVRYSIENPRAYIDSNVVGFLNILEACRKARTPHLVYASSSSVYGLNTTRPFSTRDNVDHPASLYAATKRANELMAHTYSHLYGIPTTGLRFFTVYGPWGRPDMAYFKFARAIIDGRPIDVYNNGDMLRDFTYIDDIVDSLVRVINRPPSGNASWNSAQPDPASSSAPYRIYNLGNNRPEKLGDFIAVLEEAIGIKADKHYLPMQPGDVYATEADVDDLRRDFGWSPSTPIRVGLKCFAKWFLAYGGRA